MAAADDPLDGFYRFLWPAPENDPERFAFLDQDLGGRRSIEFLREHAVERGVGPATVILDAGCGKGRQACTLANEFGPHGVTVNVVLPAGLSSSYEAFYKDDPKRAEAVARLNPMRRHGRAEEDVGGAVLGLVSDAARYVTGQSLYVDGGANLLGLPQLHGLGVQA